VSGRGKVWVLIILGLAVFWVLVPTLIGLVLR